MMDAVLAEKFVKRARNYTPYNINIMNELGIIIASSDSTRVGNFHEVAYTIISTEKDEIEVDSGYGFPGGHIGINVALFLKREKVGVLGITGEPDKIRDIVPIVKMSLEVMLEYEAQNKKHYQQQNLRTRFIDGLLYQEEADSEGELTAVSEQLGYDPHLLRIPLMISFEKQEDAYRILEQLRREMMVGQQDIGAATRDNNLIVFRSVKGQDRDFGEHLYELEEYLVRLKEFFERYQVVCRYYVGSFQDKFRYYRNSFRHCQWLKRYCRGEKEQEYFFYDYVGEYLRSLVPMNELNRIYASFCMQFDSDTVDSMVELIEVLRKNNYNLNESSKELFIHKNTLIFRYNKIKNMFHVNPIQSTADREFLDWLALYLKMNR